jgi:hypothetical protein
MLITVGDFCDRARQGMNGLVRDLQEQTGRYGDAERNAWESSLGLMAQVLRRTGLDAFHLQLGQSSELSLEYRLPSSASWCDAVLLGRGEQRPTAVLIELKNWSTAGDRPGPREGLVQHQGKLALHPAEQLKGYVEYCRQFHSAVHEYDALVEGCVFMTGTDDASAYVGFPHDDLSLAFPTFTRSAKDLTERLPRHLESLLRRPDHEFALGFEHGLYRQDRNFVRQIAKAIEDPTSEQFVLLDHQRLGFERCLDAIDTALTTNDRKAVIVIDGPPGSGKSVLAMKLWARLVQDPRIARDNVVFSTTSGSQRANWMALFQSASGRDSARGVVVPANQFNPGLTPIWVKSMRDKGHTVDVATWRENVKLFLKETGRNRAPDDHFAVTIVDEAHALIDPTVPGKEGIAPSGWAMHAGPQAYQIVRGSRVSIFLMDSEQSYRDNETTTPASIANWAQELGAPSVVQVSLAEGQFRCAGSKEYVDWLDNLLLVSIKAQTTSRWRRREGKGDFEFEIASDPLALEESLREKLAAGRTARLAASYSRPWRTKDVAMPHELPPAEMDFDITFARNGTQHRWAKIWNYAPDSDYTLFVQAPVGSAMQSDPLCEVGCPYVIRGFDYDYLGLLWMRDLIWRDGAWYADPEQIHETAWRKTLAAAKRKNAPAKAREDLTNRLLRGYRILLSRAIRGVHVWFEDDETRDHVESMLTGT